MPIPRMLRIAAAAAAVLGVLAGLAALSALSAPGATSAETRPETRSASSTAALAVHAALPLPATPEAVAPWMAACQDADPERTHIEACLSWALTAVQDHQGDGPALAEVARLLRDVPELGGLCHVPTHTLGRDAFARSGTIEGAVADGDGTCEFGFYHGAFEAWGVAASPAEVVASASAACSSVPTTEADLCPHAVGHAAWPASGGELPVALDICGTLERDAAIACAVGVNMSMVDGLGGTEPLRFDSPGDALAHCDTFPDRYRVACLSDVGTLVLQAVKGSVPDALSACAALPGPTAAELCVSVVGYHAGFLERSDLARLAGLCTFDDDELTHACLRGALKKLHLLGGPDGTTDPEIDAFCAAVPGSFTATCRELAVAGDL